MSESRHAPCRTPKPTSIRLPGMKSQRFTLLSCLLASLIAAVLSGCRQTSQGRIADAQPLAVSPAAPRAIPSNPSVASNLAALPAAMTDLSRLPFSGDESGAPDASTPPATPESISPSPETRTDLGLPDGPIRLADVEQLALSRHPGLAEAVAQLDAARGEWLQVGLKPNPTVGYSGQQLGSHGQAEQQGVYLGQMFVTGGKLRLSRESAAWRVQRAEREVDMMRMRVLTDVRVAFYQVLIAQQRRVLADELVRTSDKAVRAAEALFQGQEVSEADPLRARLAADAARIIQYTAVNRHDAAWRQLMALLYAGPVPPRQVEGTLDPAQWQFDWQAELDRLLAESPQLAAALADVEAARWAVRRAYAQVVPDLDVQAVIQDDRGTGGSNANLQVTLPLPLWNRNQGGIQQAFGNQMAAEQRAERVRLDLQSRLAQAFQRYETARNQVDAYARSGGILDKSRRTLELLRSGYQAEEFGIIDLLSAQRIYFETNLAYLDALGELATAAMEIRGLLLRGSLSP